MTTRVCPVCGNEFQVFPKHPDVTFCSRTCFGLFKRKRTILNCFGCGIEFAQNTAGQRYCTAECGFKHRPRPARDESKHAIFTCKWCGKEFEAWAYRNPTICSAQCRSEYGARQPKRKRNTEYIDKKCAECGKTYQILKSYDAIRVSMCCSKECHYKRMSKLKQGAGNPNYIGGTRHPNRGPNWHAQRRKALKRDGYKCRVCGKKIGRVKHDHGVHHITPYKAYAGDWKTANRLSNLITLCRECHPKAERGEIPVQRSLL